MLRSAAAAEFPTAAPADLALCCCSQGIGGLIDSFFEYLLKAAVMTSDPEYLQVHFHCLSTARQVSRQRQRRKGEVCVCGGGWGQAREGRREVQRAGVS